MTRSRFFVVAATGIFAVTGLACAPPPEPGEEATDDPLYGGGSLANTWQNDVVPVCFRQGSDTAALADTRDHFRTAVEDTWARVSSIRFNWLGTCRSNTATDLPRTIAVALAQGADFSNFGTFANRWTEMSLSARVSNTLFRNDAMHEMGHALAFVHEQERPDNFDASGNPINCSLFDPNNGTAPFSFPGGRNYTFYDADSIMNYCAGFPTALSGGDVLGVQSVYTPAVDCQELSDTYGIRASVTFGFAPPEVQNQWRALACNTVPSSPDTCQKASDRFGIVGGGTFGFAPVEAREFWQASGCNARPRSSVGLCQRAADTYNIVPNVSFGSAPPEVHQWWSGQGCNVKPRPKDGCQRMSDIYGLSPGDNGWAPADARTWFTFAGCQTTPVLGRCQMISDLYGTDAGITFAFAPPEAQSYWQANGCSTRPSSPNACQSASELYGINASVNFGFAPVEARDHWVAAGCNTKPYRADTCQKIASDYTVLPSFAFGAASQPIRDFWVSNGCNARPR